MNTPQAPQSGANSTLVTCHSNADFDALAAMLAAARLSAPCDLLFPGTQEKNLDALYAELKEGQDRRSNGCAFVDAQTADWARYRRLVVVDTRQRSRLQHVWPLLDNPQVETEVWDHHPDTADDIPAHTVHVAVSGSATSMLVERIRERGLDLSPEEATLLGLGIYSDTGSFSYSSTRSSDFEAAAWLLGQGMDINAINERASFEMTKAHVQALNSLLESAETFACNGAQVVLAEATLEHYLGDFAYLAHRLMEMEKFEILFAIGRMDDRIQVVARSRSNAVNVGAICSAFGGGGHVYAASASVRDKSLAQVRDEILRQLRLQEPDEKRARDYMSSPAIGLEEGHSIAEADELMLHFGLKGVPIFAKGTRRCLGVLDVQVTQKALAHGLGSALVDDYMLRRAKSLPPTADLRDITTVIVGSRQRLVPIVEDDAVVGVVTRTDLINIFAREPGRMEPQERSPRSRSVSKALQERMPDGILELLTAAASLGRELGMHVYAVGGFVRDLLLKTPNYDIDLVVENANPEGSGNAITYAQALAARLGGRVREHQKFLTCTVVYPGSEGKEERVDVATARLEYYEQPGALPTVEHSSIRMDLYRRDFTINALAIRLDVSPMGQIVDFFGGQRDIKDKLIRVLHTLSFVEDPTRCLRAVRFEQRYGFRIGPGTEKLIKNAVALKLPGKLSPSRIFNEFEHICAEETASQALMRLSDLGLLQAIHPLLAAPPEKEYSLSRVAKVVAWYRLLYFEEPMRPWMLYFLALAGQASYAETLECFMKLGIPLSFKEELIGGREKMRYARQQLRRLMKQGEGQFKVSELCRALHPLPLECTLYLMAEAKEPETRRAISRYITSWRIAKPDLDGHDLERAGLAPGPAYGVILRRLLQAKLDGEAPDPAAQEALAAELVQMAKDGRLEIPRPEKKRLRSKAARRREEALQEAGKDRGPEAGTAAAPGAEPDAGSGAGPEAAPAPEAAGAGQAQP